MPKKHKTYNNFDEMDDDIPEKKEKDKQKGKDKKKEKYKKNYNDFETNNIINKADNKFKFDKVIISPSIIIKQFPQISSIVEEYKKSDKNLEEASLEKPLIQEFNSISSNENKKSDKNLEKEFSLQKSLKTTFHFDSNFIPPIDFKNKKYLINLEIKNIYENKSNNDTNNENVNERNNENVSDKNNENVNDKNNENINDKNNENINDKNNENVNDKDNENVIDKNKENVNDKNNENNKNNENVNDKDNENFNDNNNENNVKTIDNDNDNERNNKNSNNNENVSGKNNENIKDKDKDIENIKDKDNENDKNNDKNNIKNNENSNDKNNIKNNVKKNENVNDNDKRKKRINLFYFDKNIIPLPYDLNENITFQTFQILEDFKTKSYEKILLNSNPLIQPKIPFIKAEKSYVKPVFNQYKEKYIFTISKESFINKIKLKDCNFNEIENINNILKRKKYKNIFENNKNMLNERPIIELNENKKECLISYQTIINKKIFLYDSNFSFDDNTIKKLDETHNIDINYFDFNQLTNLYKKKNLKLLYLNNSDTVKKMKLILEENEKNDTVFSNNQKRLIRKGFTKRIETPETDNEKINLKCNIFHPLLIENVNNKKFKSFSIENSTIEKIKIKINKDMNIISKIIYTYKQDINTCKKIKLPKENSIEEVNDYYSKKNLVKINSPNNLYSKKDDLDIFNDIDLDYNYKLYKKFKEKKRKKMNKFLKSGKASTFLVNNDNLKMSITHSQVYYNSNYNNIANKEDLILKNDNKKFKSLQINSVSNFSNKNKIENIKKSNMTYSDLGSNDNEKEKEHSGITLRKIKKTNNEINRKNKKVYINKLKMEQDNKFEQELKKEKRFKFLFPIFFSVIPLFYALYQKFTFEE